MTYEDKVLAYIAQPENLPVALEVAEAVQKLRDDLHRKFWPIFSAEMNRRLVNSADTEKWKFSAYPINRLKKEFEFCSFQTIQPKGAEQARLKIIFGQGGREGNYRLMMGVVWDRKLPAPNHPALRNFKKELIDRQLINSWDWWPGWRYAGYALEGGEFMVKFYHSPNEVVTELADEYWQLFVDLRPVVEIINEALAQPAVAEA